MRHHSRDKSNTLPRHMHSEHSHEKLDNLPRYVLDNKSQGSQTTCTGMCSMITLGRSQTTFPGEVRQFARICVQ